MVGMERLRIALLLIGTVCSFSLISVSRESVTIANRTVSELRVGVPFSPWYHRVNRDGVVTWNLGLLSLSTLMAIVAAGCFIGYARLRRQARENLEGKLRAADG
jgi:hypothetical protein